MTYFKSAGDYNNNRYFSCENYNKKSKNNKSKKMCEAKIKIDIIKETAQFTKLHSNECLENTFGQLSIIPSLKKEITKRDHIMQFANKLLALNPAINLMLFKEVIYRICYIQKYTLNISDAYLKNYFYNWKNKNHINSFYFAHDHPNRMDDNQYLQTLCEKIIFDPETKKQIKLIYLIWASPFHLNRIRFSPQFYLDFTYMKPLGMLQILVLLYLDLYI